MVVLLLSVAVCAMTIALITLTSLALHCALDGLWELLKMAGKTIGRLI